MDSENTIVVLMTACIDPVAAEWRVHRADPLVRLHDYQSGLRFWLQLPDVRIGNIVFVENSGYDLQALRDMVRDENPQAKSVEFLQTNDNYIPPGGHYGYPELLMIDRALAHSELLRTSSHMIKASGRLTFPSVSKLLDRLPRDTLFAVDCRDSGRFRAQTLPRFVRTELMIFATNFYRERLVGAHKDLRPGKEHIENLFYERLITFKGHAGAILRWPVSVDPAGYAAHWDKRYDSLKQRLLYKVRSVARVLLPHWWI
jgi:hypothetical protein